MKVTVNGQERDLRLIGINGIDWSADLLSLQSRELTEEEFSEYETLLSDYAEAQRMVDEFIESLPADEREEFSEGLNEICAEINDWPGYVVQYVENYKK